MGCHSGELEKMYPRAESPGGDSVNMRRYEKCRPHVAPTDRAMTLGDVCGATALLSSILKQTDARYVVEHHHNLHVSDCSWDPSKKSEFSRRHFLKIIFQWYIE